MTVFTELPNSSGKVSRKDTFYDSTSKVTRVDSYDFGVGAPGALLQSVTYNYGSWNGSSCVAIGNNITSRPCQTTVLDGSGATKSQALLTYDSHGNLLTQQNMVSPGVYLTKNYTYNANGTPATMTDVNGAQSTFSNYVCNGQYPGTYAIGALSSNYTWDCNGGVVTQVKDANTQPTAYAYSDPFWRLTSVTDPLNNVTTTSYTPNSVDTKMVFGSSTTETVTTLDGIGRTSLVQRRTSPTSSLYDTVQYSYDSNGRLLSVSQPCQVALSAPCTTPVTTYAYDAAWRTTSTTDAGTGTVTQAYTGNDVLTTLGPNPAGENTKKRQMEYDGLSRLTSVCEITGATGSGTCAQSTSQTGFWTKYTYDALGNLTGVSQNAQGSPTQSRSYLYDALSRMTSETNPESGTTAYLYDSAGADNCSPSSRTSAGDLLRKTDANGNYVCYSYDGFHRPTDIGNNFDTATNPCKRFRYDNTTGVLGSIPTGISVSNPLGRLVEAETDNCTWPITSGSIITDEWSSYSKRGEVTDAYESTLHSGGYYHVIAAYWANGALSQLSGVGSQGTGSQGAYNYGLDGEGRLYSNTQSTNNFVTSTTYNAASQPLTVSLKLGDSDSYTYDPNTGRMLSFTFTVGSAPKSLIGGLTWNANGSLRTLQLTDGFNSAGSYTCNYGTSTTAGYDDLGRLASANCGSASSQSFSYDAFGNLTKSGTSAWMPGYNQSTNRYTLAGTTYDAAGNLLNDSFHSYTWNVYGKLASVDSNITLTNDANDRVVEKNVSGTFTEVQYGPLGKLCTMNGRTEIQCYVPLPGGEIMSPGPDTFWHADWMGSIRLASSASQRTITFDRGFAPFGETLPVAGGSSNVQFGGLTQDTISGEYDTDAREYHPGQGRWISPDPGGIAAVDPGNPQSWNRYAYVTNNPLSLVDPSGLDGCNDGFPSWGADFAGGGGTYNGGWIPGADASPSDGFGSDGCYTPAEMWDMYQARQQQILEGENSINFPMGTGNLFGDIWNALGLPSGLSCPDVGGLSSYLCGGVNPIKDVDKNTAKDDCLKNNSAPGKVVAFGSVLQLAPGWGNDVTKSWGEWIVSPLLKLGALAQLAKPTVTYSIKSGLPTVSATVFPNLVARGALRFTMKWAPLGIVAATAGDIQAHANCRNLGGDAIADMPD